MLQREAYDYKFFFDNFLFAILPECDSSMKLKKKIDEKLSDAVSKISRLIEELESYKECDVQNELTGFWVSNSHNECFNKEKKYGCNVTSGKGR